MFLEFEKKGKKTQEQASCYPWQLPGEGEREEKVSSVSIKVNHKAASKNTAWGRALEKEEGVPKY